MSFATQTELFDNPAFKKTLSCCIPGLDKPHFQYLGYAQLDLLETDFNQGPQEAR
jgi:hypothetical protein